MNAPRRVLDPVDRTAEVLFGLFMVLTFTGTMNVATAGAEDVRAMMWAAIGCNTAWGFVDGVMYVLRTLVTRGHKLDVLRRVRAQSEAGEGARVLRDEIGAFGTLLLASDLENLRQRIVALPADRLPERPRLRRDDLVGACSVFALVVLSTFPVVLPFVFVDDLQRAMRVSAAIAIAMLFGAGWAWGRYAGLPPWRAGLTMAVLGLVIEAVVIARGG
jgi:VIT1/CCC1 family predicted Fe2+/Mn2+ transporter